MPTKQLIDFLNRRKIKYISIMYSPAFTTEDIAAITNTYGRALARAVIIKLDGEMTMLVLPASESVNFADLKHASHAKEIELATAPEFADMFPGCVVDAIPPFGNLYGLEVLIADSLTSEEEITFNAGTRYELKMAYDVYRCLVQPKVIKLSIATVH